MENREGFAYELALLFCIKIYLSSEHAVRRKLTFSRRYITIIWILTRQPRSQGLSSLPPLSLRKDPGSLWSRVCQNLEGSPNVCWGMGGNVGLVDIAKKGISTQLILWPDDHRQNV